MKKTLDAHSQQLKNHVKEHQAELDTARADYQNEIASLSHSHTQEQRKAMDWYEQQLQEMREFFDTEKEKSEQRYLDEKERVAKRTREVQIDLETKHKTEVESLEDEICQVTQQLNQFQIEHVALVRQFEQDALEKQFQVQSLTNELAHLKQAESTHTLKHETITQLNSQLQSLYQKYEQQQSLCQEKEQQLQSIKQCYEKDQEKFQRTVKQLEESLSKEDCDKASLIEKYDQLKQKHDQVLDELSDLRNSTSKEHALMQQ